MVNPSVVFWACLVCVLMMGSECVGEGPNFQFRRGP